MDLGRAGWLAAVVREGVAALRPQAAEELSGGSPRARARRALVEGLRVTGLLHGVPLVPAAPVLPEAPPAPGTSPSASAAPPAPGSSSPPSAVAAPLVPGSSSPLTAAIASPAPGTSPSAATAPPAAPVSAPGPEADAGQHAFFAVIRALVRLAVILGERSGTSEAGLAERLLSPLAALAGALELSEALARQGQAGKGFTPRQWRKVEAALAARAESLSGDPPHGLLLHTGAVQIAGRLFGHLVLEALTRPAPSPERVRRLTEVAARQRAVLFEVQLHLACAERPLADPVRRAVLLQLERLALPAPLQAALKVKVKGGVAAPLRIAEVVAGVQSQAQKRRLLEQALLGALVDGRRSPAELTFLARLADALGISPEERARQEAEMAELYAEHRGLVDVLTTGAGFGRGEELVDSARASLEKNYRRLLREAKETGELSVLLAKAARGVGLTADERRRMRAQLLDLAKAIPALAIFAAPGGMLLLMALAKVLPFSLLPSAFQDDADR